MGEVKETAQLLQVPGLTWDAAIFGSGKILRMAEPAGDVAGTLVSTLPVTGSVGAFSQGVPSLAVRRVEKSPFFSATVGTFAVRALPRRSRFHSSDQKKNNLSFTIGPPTLYPQSLRRRTSFFTPFKLLK